MKIEELQFRYVMPMWETRRGDTVLCIEPEEAKGQTRPLISRPIPGIFVRSFTLPSIALS